MHCPAGPDAFGRALQQLQHALEPQIKAHDQLKQGRALATELLKLQKDFADVSHGLAAASSR